MKKTLLFACAAIMMGAGAHAGFVADETVTAVGFVGPETIVTVSQARDMRDNTDVILRGKITSNANGDDKYIFQDDTGTVIVEIDDDVWNGQTITPGDTVTIYGEIDRGIFTTEIDVDSIKKM